MDANERLEQLLSNNLANEETPGFKSSFAEFLEDPVDTMYKQPYGSGLGTAIGQTGNGVVFQEGVPSFAPGAMQQTGRSLDISITDTTPSGPLASVQGANNAPITVAGPISPGIGNRLGVNGQPLAVYGSNGQAVAGMYAVRNPAYQGSTWVGSDGLPDYDASGNPSYLIENAQGQVVYTPGTTTTQPYALRVGTSDDMGDHSFYAVNYVDSQGQKGIALTKDGALQLDANNNLTDAAGHEIIPIGPNGQPIVGGRIQVNPNYTGSSIVSATGQPITDANGQPSFRVYDANGNLVNGGRLGTVDADVTQLQPLGETEFMVGNSYSTAAVLPQLKTGTGQLNPGELEQSNVDPTSTMTQMMSAMNMYEANQRMVQTEDTVLNEAVNDVGKVNNA